MTAPESINAPHASPARDLLAAARPYFGRPTAVLAVAIVAVGAGLLFNWSWLVAAGIAPVLVSALPCVLMCALGLCMNKMIGGGCAQESKASAQPEEQPRGGEVNNPSSGSAG